MLTFLKVQRNWKNWCVCLCRYQNPHVHITICLYTWLISWVTTRARIFKRGSIWRWFLQFLLLVTISIVWYHVYEWNIPTNLIYNCVYMTVQPVPTHVCREQHSWFIHYTKCFTHLIWNTQEKMTWLLCLWHTSFDK